MTANNRLLLWDLPGDRLTEVPADRVRGDALSFSADSKSLAYRAWDGTIRLVDTATHRSRILRGHRTRITRLVRTLQGPFHLASGDANGFVRLWNLHSGATAVLHAHPGAVENLAFSPDGRALASSGEDASSASGGSTSSPTSHATDRDAAWLQAHTSAVIDLVHPDRSGETRPPYEPGCLRSCHRPRTLPSVSWK